MDIKIIKYIKFSINFFIIISLTIPIYAEKLSSDGSAFVTKAEFDAKFSEFNQTLTEFEMSLNTKIDTQVSSYLDKNGIWSPKAQKLETTFISYAMSDIMPLTIFGSDLHGYNATKNLNKVLLIKEANKSGLLFINAYHGIKSSSGNKLTTYGENTLARGFMYITTNQIAYDVAATDYKIYYSWSQFSPTNLNTKLTESPPCLWLDKNITIFGSSNTAYNSTVGCQLHLFPLRGFSILNLFVSRGNSVYFTPFAAWSSGGNLSQFSQMSGNFSQHSVQGSIAIVLDSANIY